MKEYKVKVEENKETWFLNENTVKEIYYHENGNKKCEFYYLDDKFHREDGPASIYYRENGNIKYEYYYLNNEPINKNDYIVYQRKRKLKKLFK